jgi:putative MATE family efflux protein
MSDTQEHKTDFLGRDAIFPLLIKLGVPAAVGMLVNALYNVVDTIYVGLGVGPLAIAALSIVFPIQMIVSALAQAIGMGSASIVSRRLGEKRPEEATRTIGSAYASVFLLNLVVIGLLYAFMRPLLAFFGASEAIMPYAIDYLGIVGGGFFFFGLSMCANNLLRSAGNARASMSGMIVGAVLNAILAPVFIFGFHLAVKGAAIATVISQAISCVYLFGTYVRGKSHVPLRLRDLRVDWSLLRESLGLGLPTFIQSAGMSILTLIANTSLGRYGGDSAITSFGMISRLNQIIILPIIGVVAGFQPIAGYNFGARRYDRVKEALRVTVLTAFCLSLVGYAFLMLAPRLCMAMFTTDRGLIDASARALRILSMLIPLAAVQIAGSNYFLAVGRPVKSLLLSTSRQFLILVPLILVLPHFLGLDGIWYAYPLADFLASALTLVFLVREVSRLGKTQAGLPLAG